MPRHAGAPDREFAADRLQHGKPRIEFDAVFLAVVKSDRLDMVIAAQRPGQAGGGVLTTGEEHERTLATQSRLRAPACQSRCLASSASRRFFPWRVIQADARAGNSR